MTGRGEGYCALPVAGPKETRLGYTGVLGRPVLLGRRFLGEARPRLGRAFRRGRGRGRGRRFRRW
jgi:hypothetical protein